MKMTLELPDTAKLLHLVAIIGDENSNKVDLSTYTEYPKEGRTIKVNNNGHWEVKDNG